MAFLQTAAGHLLESSHNASFASYLALRTEFPQMGNVTFFIPGAGEYLNQCNNGVQQLRRNDQRGATMSADVQHFYDELAGA
ncbi:MAG: hypothetical protein KC496_17160, partial [Anaerolineae bacterium]|nr:hypothetical protein [Anaerolineae bacterium]